MKQLLVFLSFIIITGCAKKKDKGDLVVKDVIVNVDVVKREEMDDETWKVKSGINPDHAAMVNELIDGVISGVLTAYKGIPDNEADTMPLSKQQILDIIEPVDTVYTENPDSSLMEKKVIKNEFDAGNITSLRFKESWFYNKKTRVLTKEVTAVQLVKWSFTEKGEFKGDQPILWIKMQKQE